MALFHERGKVSVHTHKETSEELPRLILRRLTSQAQPKRRTYDDAFLPCASGVPRLVSALLFNACRRLRSLLDFGHPFRGVLGSGLRKRVSGRRARGGSIVMPTVAMLWCKPLPDVESQGIGTGFIP
jgi:hypothetical protein